MGRIGIAGKLRNPEWLSVVVFLLETGLLAYCHNSYSPLVPLAWRMRMNDKAM